MTTRITIHPAGHHVAVMTTDSYDKKHDTGHVSQEKTETTIFLKPGDPPLDAYSTTTRMISVIDMDPVEE